MKNIHEMFSPSTSFPSTGTNVEGNLNLMWVDQREEKADTYVAFRGEFDLPEPGEIEIRLLGVSWFCVW